MLIFIHAVFVIQSKSGHFTQGSQTMEIFGTPIVTFETEVANFENDIASEKRPYNQHAFIKINDLGVILLGKEFSTYKCTQLCPYYWS